MPLLLPIALLCVVLAVGFLLGLVGMLRRPFQAPRWQPVFAWMLTLRALLLTLGILVAFGIAAWRHPDAVGALGLGLLAGAVLGAGSAVTAGLQRNGTFTLQRPHRLFAVLVALAVLGRALASLVDMIAGRDAAGLLPMLGGLLGGYALAHSIVLRMRLARRARLQPTR
ncbi:hypothetical protein [Cognatilysobacter lacus]|uniref:Uncharacterized protein n=1 Tax=Cognatilysobacter lacus TaxID=1643323 RepID=A0A5D8Z6L9_9GAMM|nr:hypothetical protein [Lysobacter lacus]TZF90421.1 hypothetical protein FW784_05305 [Lysobacter lacus]